MQKLLLVSVVIATFAVPVVQSRSSSRPTWLGTLVPFSALVTAYVLLLRFVYPRLS